MPDLKDYKVGDKKYYIEREGIEKVTLDHLIDDIEKDPSILDKKSHGPINTHWFSIKREGGGLLFGSSKIVIRQKD